MELVVALVFLLAQSILCNELSDSNDSPNQVTDIKPSFALSCSTNFFNIVVFPYMVIEGEPPTVATETEAPEEDDDLTSFAEFKEKAIQSIEAPVEVESRPASGPPLTRNYASVECGAKVIATNPGAKNPSAILNSNKDHYLFNDCSNDIFFIVELCELISVRTIVMGSLELFSSIPKSFQVLAAERYEHEGSSQPSLEDWTLIGTFAAANERTEQSFPLSTEGQVYAKYIMVIMETHYGQERVCPINTFKVIGASMIEVYEESESEGVVSPPTANVIPPTDTDGLSEDLSLLESPGNNGETADYNGAFLSTAKDVVYRILEQPLELLGTVIKPDGKNLNGDDSAEHAQIEENGVIEEGPNEEQEISQPLEVDSLVNIDSENDDSSSRKIPEEKVSNLSAEDPDMDSSMDHSGVVESSKPDVIDIGSKVSDDQDHQDSVNTCTDDLTDPQDAGVSADELLGPAMSHDLSHDLLGPVDQDLASVDSIPTNLEGDDLLSMPTPHPEALEPPLEAPPPHQEPIQEPNAVTMTTEGDSQSSINRTANLTIENSLEKTINSSSNVTNKMGVVKNETGESTNGNGAPSAPRDKEKSVFLRLSNQIKELQVNMTLFSSYLDQIRSSLKRSKNRTEETTRSLDRRLTTLNATLTQLQNETSLKVSLLENLSIELHLLSSAMVNSTMEMTTFDNKITLSLFVLIVLQCSVLLPLLCCYWMYSRQQHLQLQTELQALKLAIERLKKSSESNKNNGNSANHQLLDNSSELSASCSMPLLREDEESHDSHEWQVAEGRYRKKHKLKSRY